MEQLWFYFDLGLRHVLDLKAIDHLLFIAAFTAPFHFGALRKLLWWTTLFTFGHTLSLIGNYYYQLDPPATWIEFLIPVSIIVACIPLMRSGDQARRSKSFFSVLIFIFGIVHGFGFSRYFGMVVPEDSANLALLSFAFGVEAAQILIIAGVLVLEILLVRLIALKKEKWQLIVGAMIASQALGMCFQNWPL